LRFNSFKGFFNHTQDSIISLHDEVIAGMNMAMKSNNDIVANSFDHNIPNTIQNIHELGNILFDRSRTKDDKISNIIVNIMNPRHVDVIVTGDIDSSNKTSILVQPLVIIKSQKKIMSEALKFKKDELVCENPISKKKILCKSAYGQIAKAVKKLLEKL
jgi:hypothetical protein